MIKKNGTVLSHSTEQGITSPGNNQGQVVSNSTSLLKDHDLFYDS